MKQKIALMLDPEWDRDGRPEFCGPVHGWNLTQLHEEQALRWADEDDLPDVQQLSALEWVRKTEQAVLRGKRTRRMIQMRRERVR